MQQTIPRQLTDLVEQAFQSAQQAGDLPTFEISSVQIERSRHAEHGDYATSTCLKLASVARMNPLEIARQVAAHLPPIPFIGEVEAVAPGYINFRLNPDWLVEQINVIATAGETYACLDIGRGQTAQVEFVSANPTGPLTVGRGRGGVMGDTLANLLTAAGYETDREYYFNNAGRQMEILGNSVRLRYLELLGQEVEFPDDHYQGDYIREIAAELYAEHGDALAEAEGTVFKDYAEADIFTDIRATLARINIFFDNYFNEDSLRASGKVWETLDALREEGYVYEEEGATWFRAEELGGRKDRVLVRSNGEPTYRLPDIAYHVEKIRRGYTLMVTVLGSDHIVEYPDVQAGLEALGYRTDNVQVVFHQFVTLIRGGEQVRMSTRKGHFVTLDELIDEVGPDAVRYFMLARSPESHMNFDMDLAVEQSDRNPVYYIQYAHARISSIIRHAEELGWALAGPADLTLLHHPSEMALLRKMLELPEIIEQAVDRLTPHLLPFYAQELAAAFHTFYRDCRVVSTEPGDEEISRARLKLIQAAQVVLAHSLHLMGMSAPERM